MPQSDDILRRVPPQNQEAEQSVLGAVLLDENAIDAAIEVITADDFYREAHRTIFQCMIELAERRIPIDALTLSEWLRTKNALEQCGGPGYIAELASVVPTASNCAFYARIVHDKAVLRRMGSVATDIASSSYENPANVEEFVDLSEQRIFEIAQQKTRPAFYSSAQLVRQSIKTIEMLYENHDAVTGTATGYADLDRETRGLQRSDLIIIAGRPSMGKTALALNIAAHVGIRLKQTVAFFSLEMSKEQLMLRLLCSEARIDIRKCQAGFLGSSEFPKVAAAAASLTDANIFIDDASDTTVLQAKAKCRRLARERDLGLVVVDYLQLLRSSEKMASREREIAQFSAGLKDLAKKLKVPVLALAQLNRQVENRQDKRPMLADLRESGAIEQDADVIAFIYRDEYYHGRESREPGTAEVIIAKQRNGPAGVTSKLAFLSEYQRFENYIREGLFDNGNNV